MDTPITKRLDGPHERYCFSARWRVEIGWLRGGTGRRGNHLPFGTKPQGFLIYTREGFVSAQLMKPGRFPFQSKDWNQGTPDEFREAGSGYIAYCGVYEVNEGKETVTHIPFVALLPNLIKEKQLRFVALSAEMLTLRAVAFSVENGISVTSRMDWKRAGC